MACQPIPLRSGWPASERASARPARCTVFDLTIERGETVALLGPNGAGKSTTINIMLGLLPPDRGSVELFGSAPQKAIGAGRVGAMLQDQMFLPNATVRDFITLVQALPAIGVAGTDPRRRRAH